MKQAIKKLNIFISYSHKNTKYKEKLLISLEALKQSYNINPWHDGMIDAGGNIDGNIKNALLKSDVVLLLITDNFLASYYCMKIELEKAIEREKEGKCIVIPVMFQESVLSETLHFVKNNRVPEDGKPIATSFKNQSLGCTRAVNMIKVMIDNKFPNCQKNSHTNIAPKNVSKISGNKKSKTNKNSTQNRSSLYIELYKDGQLSHITLNQDIIDLIPKYFISLNNFRTMMDQSLLNARKRFNSSYKNHRESPMSDSEKLQQLRLYLMDICAYTKTYITENVGIKVHFRASKNEYYLGLIASTDNDDATDLACDWTTKMTPIPMYQGLIYHSSRFCAPLLKSLNTRLNFKGKNDDLWKDYVTFTFPNLHSGMTPLISYCISVHKDYYKSKGNILKILAYLNLGEIIEKYILDYINICSSIDKKYSLENIINTL